MVMSGRSPPILLDFLPDIEMNAIPIPVIKHRHSKIRLLCRDGYTSLFLGRLRYSKRITYTQVISQFAAMRGGIMQPINFSKSQLARAEQQQ